MKFTLCNDDKYPSLCIIKDTNHLENENVEDLFIETLFEEPPITSDHYTEQGHMENLNYSSIIVAQNVISNNYQVDCYENTIINNSLDVIEEDVFSSNGDNGQLTCEGDVTDNTRKEESKSFSSNVQLDHLGRGKEDLGLDQISCTNNFPLTQSLESNELKDVVHERVDTKITSMSDNRFESRDAFTFLHSKTFYSLYPYLFDGPNGMELSHGHLARYSLGLDSTKV